MAVKKKTTSLKALHEAQLYAQQQRDAAAIAFVVLALAGGAILWLMLRRDKNTRG